MKARKRALALLLTAALTVTGLAGTAATAWAEGEDTQYQYTDPYVLTYEGSDAIPEFYQEYCKPYLYASPHMSTMAIRDLDTGKMVSWYCSQQVYNMINTTLLDQQGEGAYASLEVYCTDACINAGGGSSYRRVNLEDSTYFDADTAGRIRAVFMSSFPYIKDVSAIADSVNAWLAAQGGEYTAVSGLTAAEVVTATQYTIWVLANGDDVRAQKPYSYTESYTAEELAEEVVYVTNEYMDCTEGQRDTTANNIAMVQAYLAGLEPVTARKTVASEAVLTVDGFDKTRNGDGTYDVTVHYTAGVQLGSDDTLVLTAYSSTVQESVALTAENLSGSITLTGVKLDEDVTVEINGYQVGGDVYLFDSTGDRSSSQSMVGYDSSKLPVHAQAVVESADHVLNIYKTTGKDDGEKPLANIEFAIYFVASMEDITSGKTTLSEKPTGEELALYQTDANKVATVKTDAAGFASYNLTANGQADGVYLIVELPNAAVTEAIEPFFAAIPGTTADGSGTVNVVKVYPKNTVETGPNVKKDVTEIENDHDTFDVGQTHTWIIRGGVPAGMAEAVEYIIRDTLDYRLTYQGNIIVKVGLESDAAGTEAVTLTAGTDYTVETGADTDADGHAVDTFSVSLTAEGMKKAAAAVVDDAVYEVRVYFDAVIDTDAQLGVNIPNQATLEYKNSAGVEYKTESDKPEVHTGGANLLKLDSQTDATLAGATFQIAREATAAELADPTVEKHALTVDGQELQVVFVDFYTNTGLTGEAVSEVTTGADGKAAFCGLAYGSYYLVETKAPEEYNLLSAPVAVEIDADSHGEEQAVTVYNAKFKLPETGGMGTVLFTVVGVVMIAAGAAFVVALGRKKKEQA